MDGAMQRAASRRPWYKPSGARNAAQQKIPASGTFAQHSASMTLSSCNLGFDEAETLCEIPALLSSFSSAPINPPPRHLS